MVLTFWKVSHRNLQSDKNQTWDKGNVFIDDIKLTFFDGQDADSLGRGFDEGHYPAAPLFKILQTMSDSKEKYKTTLCMVSKEEVATTFQLILTVLSLQPYF